MVSEAEAAVLNETRLSDASVQAAVVFPALADPSMIEVASLLRKQQECHLEVGPKSRSDAPHSDRQTGNAALELLEFPDVYASYAVTHVAEHRGCLRCPGRHQQVVVLE